MGFKPCHRTLLWEWGYWGGTINRWYKEGLPHYGGINKRVLAQGKQASTWN